MLTVLVTGAAGFIGSHLVDALNARGVRVIGVDNLSRGSRKHLTQALAGDQFELAVADLASAQEVEDLARRLKGQSIGQLWHLAANSDIPDGATDLSVDLRDTFMTTVGSLRLAEKLGIPELFFTSTSAVYGEREGELIEDSGPLLPISNYGAMKLASEAAISSATQTYLARSAIFRLPNVVGTRSTHGLIFDLFRKIEKSSGTVEVLGDGTQCKQYLHVAEVIAAMLWIVDHAPGPLDCYNIGPCDDRGITVRRIVDMVLESADSSTTAVYADSDRGWVGDVPRFRYSVKKLTELGWVAQNDSEGAVRRACAELALVEARGV